MTVPARPGRERLLRIGTFSRQARLSPHQLRHCHELDRHRTRLERRLEEAGQLLGRLRELIQEGS